MIVNLPLAASVELLRPSARSLRQAPWLAPSLQVLQGNAHLQTDLAIAELAAALHGCGRSDLQWPDQTCEAYRELLRHGDLSPALRRRAMRALERDIDGELMVFEAAYRVRFMR